MITKNKVKVYHFTTKEYGLQVLRNQRIKVAVIDELNDPFELLSADLSDRNEKRKFLSWKKSMSRKIGFICCSGNIEEPLLWSHYADKHKGVVVELDVNPECLIKVKYRKTRSKLNFDKIYEDGKFKETLAKDLGSTKYIKWNYENEYRIPIDLKGCVIDKNHYFAPTDDSLSITGIIEGPLCDLSRKDVEENITPGCEVTLSHARLAAKSYKVIESNKLGSVTITG
ncbi:MAG: DUF2971 domain-containing protein [Candidatus Thiodiazotropha sp. (ex Lucinoma borealis)]|nr:DUF2971 domain-containing protein [Candidatus Thiodiazotropha sp. (ex Lucinoma borealis)]